uniref:Cytochrome c oxidase subunit 3 n=1 Tax=Atractomorpha psittacina TaxID=1920482 RepID=A0A6G6A6D6_9ORTH|nr:cytochrome c oxidase subunit III [Atractomorpha psittacina]YP_010987348.1 cytochrome c oxidase subunit III [Atractomorpha lata]QID03855.1 cytochrome c oxidase subunit III [Atractomorpha psittacina]WOL43049.1 cytochrome c oxidase subunit III [Atractomorpha lata]
MLTNQSNHPFHMVDYSPWPLTGAIGAMTMTTGLAKWFHLFNPNLLIMGSLILILTMFQWWRDVIREGTYQGLHTMFVMLSLKWGMILFITSEVLFFISFFWSFFSSSITPSIELGTYWPPMGIYPFNPLNIPLLNTIILLASGITLTWAHHSLIENKHYQTLQGLIITVMLGIYFTMLQAYEYLEATFTLADAIYGSSFFMATGFHGLHVIIGTMFLTTCLIRHYMNQMSANHHFGFEAAAWYWHFVDIVWLFLYISIYWWGS